MVPHQQLFQRERAETFLPFVSAEFMAYLVTFAALPDGALLSFVPLELPWRS
jgi:hypothetical protein